MRGKVLDLTNQQFDRLTALYRFSKGGRSYWHCKCECGNECDVRTDSLTGHKIRSCGCLKKEKDKEKAEKIGKNNALDLSNLTFGYLQPYEKIDKRLNGHIIWKCRCLNCGTDCEVSSLYLKRGSSISCGCVSRSNGEEKICSILLENNIPFEEQKRFDTCIYQDTKRQARFDFYINNKYLLEYDGEQHYNINNPWNSNKKDQYKNQWCKENNIPLIRIPYIHLNDLHLEDLLLETSSYVLN